MRKPPVAIFSSANRSSAVDRSSMSASTAGASERDRWRNRSTTSLTDKGSGSSGRSGAGQSSATVSAVSPT